MKNIIKLSIIAVFALLPLSGFSQLLGYSGPTDMDVNGIFIGGKYTKSQVVAKWGNPTSYWSGSSENGLIEEYHYSTNLFRFSENGVFETFGIYTPNFVVYTAKSGGIKVGDPISRVSAIGIGTPVLQSDGSYRIDGDDLFTFGVSNGKIIWISFMSLV